MVTEALLLMEVILDLALLFLNLQVMTLEQVLITLNAALTILTLHPVPALFNPTIWLMDITP
jgi:hypothetical protein